MSFTFSRLNGRVVALACASISALHTAVARAEANNSFNPAISVILSGTYANLSKDPSTWRLKGFLPSGDEVGPGDKGYSLGESEIGLSANIDPYFFGALTLSVSNQNEISAEEAFIQTTALPEGLKLKAGRFFSSLGYLNDQHAHTWDFVDAPLVYQAMVGGQFGQEGIQLKWLAPTDQFLELGIESGNGNNFPGSPKAKNGGGATAAYAHTGGDIGQSHNWRAGISWLSTQAHDRTWTDVQDDTITNAFTGKSTVWAIDGVWKWSPNGNATQTNFKLQGEYFRRKEKGLATYDMEGSTPSTDDYRSTQSGWYVQGIYQFMPRWRVGLRWDQLDSGTVNAGANTALVEAASRPKRATAMVDWSLSEFSRIRVQVSDDRARVDQSDRQIFLQYQMSLGAHGAHSY